MSLSRNYNYHFNVLRNLYFGDDVAGFRISEDNLFLLYVDLLWSHRAFFSLFHRWSAINYYGIRIRGNYLTTVSIQSCNTLIIITVAICRTFNTLCPDRCNKNKRQKGLVLYCVANFQILSLMFIYLVTCYK